MREGSSYSLPAPIVRRAFFRLLPFVVAGAAFVYFGATDQSLQELAAVLAMLCVGLGIGYLLARSFTWVKLTHVGIIGYSARRPRTVIAWSEPVAMRSASYAGVECLALHPVKGGAPVLVPVSIAKSPQFLGCLSALAPPAHPLRKVRSSAA